MTPALETTDCPHAASCPGCTRLGQPYEQQRSEKREILARELGRYPRLADVAQSCTLRGAGSTLGYRTRAKWVVGPSGEVGLYGSEHRVLDLPGCIAVESAISIATARLRAALAEPRFRALAPRLRGADVRATSTGRVLVTLVALGEGGAPDPSVVPLARELARSLCDGASAAEGAVAGVAISWISPRSPQVLGAGHELLAGVAELEDPIGGARVLATFGAFVQAHREQAAAISRELAEGVGALGASPRVLELFAGSGALGLALAARGAAVEFVEAFAPAAERISRAAEGLGVAVRVHAADAEDFLVCATEGWDVVLVDPPRRGLRPPLRAALAARRPALVGYVSCDPRTLARDLDHFARLGYTTREVIGFDMMPNTDQIEALAWLVPATAPEEKSSSELDPYEPRKDALAPPEGASGAVLSGRKSELVRVRFTAIAVLVGVPHEKGRVHAKNVEARYRRVAIASGHALVALEGSGDPRGLLPAFARIGHAIAGDPRAAASTRHLFERHGLDRLALHLTRLEAGARSSSSARVAPDLGGFLASLGFTEHDVAGLAAPER